MNAKKDVLLFVAVLGAAAYGCYTGPDVDSGATPPGTNRPDAGAAVTPDATGLPCDVAKIMIERCSSCHGPQPSKGAKTSVMSRDALAAPFEGAASVAALSLERMRDAASPMPPDGLLPEAEVAIFAKWVEAGMPAGSCSSPAATPVVPPPVCSSGRFWNDDDDEGSPLMTPGRACIECHDEENAKAKMKKKDGDDDDEDEDEAPRFGAAGTVHPTLREPDDCFGLGTEDATVEIVDATGKTFSMRVNRAGNFYTELPVVAPYRAKVVRGGKVREMKTAQTSGDCNTCHAVNATEAPGRILAP